MTEKVRAITDVLDRHLGEDIVVIDFGRSGPICDYFIICTAKNDRHSESLVDFLKKELPDEAIYHIDDSDPAWQIVDYNDVMVHIFLEETRMQYRLERLWSEHPITNL